MCMCVCVCACVCVYSPPRLGHRRRGKTLQNKTSQHSSQLYSRQCAGPNKCRVCCLRDHAPAYLSKKRSRGTVSSLSALSVQIATAVPSSPSLCITDTRCELAGTEAGKTAWERCITHPCAKQDSGRMSPPARARLAARVLGPMGCAVQPALLRTSGGGTYTAGFWPCLTTALQKAIAERGASASAASLEDTRSLSRLMTHGRCEGWLSMLRGYVDLDAQHCLLCTWARNVGANKHWQHLVSCPLPTLPCPCPSHRLS